MTDPTKLSIEELYKNGDGQANGSPEAPGEPASGSRSNPRLHRAQRPRELPFDTATAEEPPGPPLPFDPMRLVDAVLRRWYLWVGVALIFGVAGFCFCCLRVKTVGSVQLVRLDPPLEMRASPTGDAFRPQLFSDTTLIDMIHSPEVFARVSAKTNPRLSVSKLASELSVVPEPDSQIVNLVYNGRDSAAVATNLLNLLAAEIVRFTQEMQARESTDAARFLGDKLDTIDIDLAQTDKQLAAIPIEQRLADTDQQAAACLGQLSDIDVKYTLARIEMETENPVAQRLQSARDDLAALLVKYTDAHPLVLDQKAKIKALENELAANPSVSSSDDSLPVVTEKNKPQIRQLEELQALRDRTQKRLSLLTQKNFDYALIKSRDESLQLLRTSLSSRQREALLYAQNAPGYYRIFHPADSDRVVSRVNWRKGLILSLVGAFFGGVLAAAFIALVEVVDPRIKTAADLHRATHLPVLATLGDLSQMSDEAKRAWAFRTWTLIKGKITETQNHSLVCGVISARKGEGRSTWVDLLARTAHERGLRVLCATTQKTDDLPLHPHEKIPTETGLTVSVPINRAAPDSDGSTAQALTPNVFAFPMQATRQLRDPKSHSILQIPLPGWVWNLERRQQWQAALDEWQRIENLVLLVELPPASVPEGILLAENLPQVVWLAESGRASTFETRRHLETLRHAGCNVVGTVLNREPRTVIHKLFSRWLTAFALIFALAWRAAAADVPLPTNTPASVVFSGPQPAQRAPWQEHLTLGPGDVLDINFYGETNMDKPGVVVGMDGRLSYLQARDIIASGLTVDELRDKLNGELGKYYRNPRVIVSPVAYVSKKYYVLGKVVLRGAFVLDRPVTIIEALARAHGVETGLIERNSIDLADLQRSFLERGGKRVPVDFERLFQEGDFSQNVALQPDDFLYLAPADLKEIFVIGQVISPGPVPYTDHSSVIGAISERGGFSVGAWKNRVVVVRGSLAKPDVFTVNTWAILDGRDADVKLQPRDIVYVANRPFIYGEELLDLAITTFIQSSVTYWEGANIHVIRSPFVPSL
jgi:protein involved in polysaccharide export with SLBB domain/capsular polysaccharide biosynthesis protein